MSRRQLLASGMAERTIDRRLRTGWLRRLHGGVYAVGPVGPPRAPFMAAVLACGSGAVVAGRSAAALWGLLDLPRRGAPVEIFARCEHRRSGIHTRRVLTLAHDERDEIEGIPVTAVGRTVVDLAGRVGSRTLERALGQADREGLLPPADLAALLARYRGRPGIANLRAVIPSPGSPPFLRSEAESRFLALVGAAGLPSPETNVSLAGYEVDFLWRTGNLVVEVDGYQDHGGPTGFERDRRRGAELAAQGLLLIRVTWRQITEDALATAVLVGQALARTPVGGAPERRPHVRTR